MHLTTIAACSIVGAVVGALLPRPAYRLAVPHDVAPAADCPHCLTPLPVGIRGWLAVGRRCVKCRKPMTPSVWVYMSACASTFAILAWRIPHRSLAEAVLLAGWLVVAASGSLLAAIDIMAKRLPTTVLSITAAVIALLIGAAGIISGQLAVVRDAIVAATVVGVAYLILALLMPGQLGMGDARLAALLGMLSGTQGWRTVLVGAALPYLLAAPIATVLLLAKRARRGTQIPFGPYLIVGAVLAPIIVSFLGSRS
jgi:leader peptidase (prepilin peptidase)/N-methyltransferase